MGRVLLLATGDRIAYSTGRRPGVATGATLLGDLPDPALAEDVAG